jgi:general secretion pathway protein L
MAEFLVIRLPADAREMATWIAVDDSGMRRHTMVTGQLEEAQKDIGDRAVIVLVPAAETLTASIDIPVRGGARLLAALPFALEEQLADDVDTLHFAAGARRESGLLPVAVVSHEKIKGWLQRLKGAGISAAKLIPENFGLARIPGTLSILAAENQVMFNDGADTEFLMQGVKPSDALAAAGVFDQIEDGDDREDGGSTSAGHLLVYCEASDEQQFEGDWAALRHELASVDINLLPDGVLPRLAITVATGAGIDLLQGHYGAKTDVAALFRPWRHAAVLFIALCVVGLGGKAVDNLRLGQEVASLQEQFSEEYRQVRPNDTQQIVDPLAIVNSIRRSLGAPEAPQAFLPSMQQLGMALAANESAQIEAISYRAGVVDVRLTAPDVATLDNIQKMISQSGRFSASIQSTDQVGELVNSRIQIKEAGA